MFSAMQVFLKVVDTQQFCEAAQQLSISASRVTRYIDDLEAHLGVKLLQRSTHRTALTDVGAQYAHGCRTLLSDLATVEARATRASTKVAGELRVAIMSGLDQQGFAALFAEYRTHHPDVSLHVTSTEAEVDLVGGRFDVGILSDEMVTSVTHISHTLIRSRVIPVAAPAYLARSSEPLRPDDLSAHRLIGFTTSGRGKRWYFEGEGEQSVRVNKSFVADSRLMQKQLALTGAGIALLPECLIANEIRQGDLVCLLDAYRLIEDDLTISLVYPSRDFLPGRVRAFVDLASRYAARSGAKISHANYSTTIRGRRMLSPKPGGFIGASVDPLPCRMITTEK
nr:LysR family transcriptional regulator [Paraburkholderia tagetis]